VVFIASNASHEGLSSVIREIEVIIP
jgi:hypothetical protein